MIRGLYAYHDALNGFMNVFIDTNDLSAKRGFLSALACADVGSAFYCNPTDYTLYKLGQVDMVTGEVIPEVPTVLVKGEKSDV